MNKLVYGLILIFALVTMLRKPKAGSGADVVEVAVVVIIRQRKL